MSPSAIQASPSTGSGTGLVLGREGPTVHTGPPSFDGLGVALLIAGMAALFTAVVRAPLTGVVLVIEMTAAASVAVPVIAASFTATLVATLLRSRPIYDQLKERAILDLAPSDPDLA